MAKRITALVILLLFLILSGTTFGATIKFSDLPESHWAHDTVVNMTLAGLFKGTTEPINGVGTFSPEKEMTRAEFITVALRAVYPRKALEVESTGNLWWKGFYELALETKILKAEEMDRGNLSKAITREEMAMISVRCVEAGGEELAYQVETSQIADFNLIGEYYKEFVIDCFSYGIICGVDSIGTFAPDKTLTRAEAATVLNRIIDPIERIEIYSPDFDEDFFDYIEEIVDEPYIPENNRDENNSIGSMDGKNDYSGVTYADYLAMTPDRQIEFQNSFSSMEKFTEWLDMVTNTTVYLPWENGGKKPRDYTYDEYEALTVDQQIAFQESFESFDLFTEWLDRATGVQSEFPWEIEGKLPEDYTFEEFNALSVDLQIAFQESFATFDDFSAWLEKALS